MDFRIEVRRASNAQLWQVVFRPFAGNLASAKDAAREELRRRGRYGEAIAGIEEEKEA